MKGKKFCFSLANLISSFSVAPGGSRVHKNGETARYGGRNVRRLILFAVSLGVVTLSSADYYVVEPSGEMYPVRKTPEGYEAVRKEVSHSVALNPGFIDTIWYYCPDIAGWYMPNRDSNTVAIQLVKSQHPCSLIGVGLGFYSPGWAELRVWQGPDSLPDSTSGMETYLDTAWHYDSLINSWMRWPTEFFSGSIGTDDPPDDLVTRKAWRELEPKIDIGTSYVWVGCRILTRTNPDGQPYGGKPWPVADSRPFVTGRHYTPCRSWMYIVQPGHEFHCRWRGYGDRYGDWEFKYVIDIYENTAPVVETYTQVLGSYDLSARTIVAEITDFSVSAELRGVDEVWLHYYLNDDLGTLDSLPMTLVSGNITEGAWEATIPSQSANTEVTYYFAMSDIQGLHRNTRRDAWSYYLGRGHRNHILFYIGSEVDYGPHDPVRAVRSQIDMWDEGEKGVADGTVFEYYNTVGEKGIIWLDPKGARMREDDAYIRRFIDAGGRLLISSHDLPADLGLADNYRDRYGHWTAPSWWPFGYDYLQLRSGTDNYEPIDSLHSFTADGVPGDLITGSLGQIFITPPRNRTGVFDSLSAGSSEIFHGPNSEIIGFRHEGTHKLVFLYWHFHEIGTWVGNRFEPDTASQNEFMRNALMWLNLTVGVDETTADIARPYFLAQNIPNPVSGRRTTISYSLPRRERISLAVYDVAGRRVKKLVDTIRESGVHTVIWSGDDDFRRNVSQGVYFYRLSAGDFTSTKKLLWLRSPK